VAELAARELMARLPIAAPGPRGNVGSIASGETR
jgi:hypothetical protein